MRLQIQIRLLYVRSANYGQKIVGIIDSNSAFVSRQDELDDACKKDTKMASQDYEEDEEEEEKEQQRQCEIKIGDQDRSKKDAFAAKISNAWNCGNP